MYSKIKLCVKDRDSLKTPSPADVPYCNIVRNETESVNNDDTDVNMNDFVTNDCFFTSVAGVFQGESLSPFLLSMFLSESIQVPRFCFWVFG